MKTFSTYYLRPYLQFALCVCLFTVSLVVLVIWSWNAKSAFNKSEIYLFSTSLLFFFIILNSIFGMNAHNRLKYYQESIFSYGSLLFLLNILSYAYSGVAIRDAESYSWIVMVLSIVYIVFLIIIASIRKIVDITMKQHSKT